MTEHAPSELIQVKKNGQKNGQIFNCPLILALRLIHRVLRTLWAVGGQCLYGNRCRSYRPLWPSCAFCKAFVFAIRHSWRQSHGNFGTPWSCWPSFGPTHGWPTACVWLQTFRAYRCAGDFSPHFQAGLGLADHFVHPVFRNMAV